MILSRISTVRRSSVEKKFKSVLHQTYYAVVAILILIFAANPHDAQLTLSVICMLFAVRSGNLKFCL